MHWKKYSLLALASLAITQCGLPAFADTTPSATTTNAPAPKISRVTGVAADPNWEEEYAYTLGVQAYTYAFPWYYNALLRWKWITQLAASTRTPSMPMNTFWHSPDLADASYKDGGMPNNDALYSVAWIDVSQEPIIVSVPEMGSRYYTIPLTGFDSDVFAYIGTRVTGNHAGHYAIVGPNWKGKLPSGVKALKPATSSTVLALARTLIDGPAELDTVHRLMAQYTLTPLSQWGKASVAPVDNSKTWAWPPFSPKDDPLADWKTINRALTEMPPPQRDAALVKQFGKIGIGPGLDVTRMDAATQRGLIRALATGKRMLTGAAYDYPGTTIHNGWRILPETWGRLGDSDDFLVRSAVQSLGGIATNVHEEAMYPALTHDASGERLSGAHRYVLHFAKAELPPVRAFWSLTAYGMDFNLIDNPFNRYSLGDRTAGLQFDADGGVTLFLQKESPGADKESNWLPTGTEDFMLYLRLYLPDQKAIRKEWIPPVMQRSD